MVLTITHGMTMYMHNEHSPQAGAAQVLAAGQTQSTDFNQGACGLPLSTSNYTTCLALLLSNSTATSSHANIPPV